MTGRIVILNGEPRAGKSSIARAVAETIPGDWRVLGVDASIAATPQALRPGIGLRPGGERPHLEPAVLELYRGLFDEIAGLARNGTDIVSDLGIHDHYSRPLGILGEAVTRLSGLPVLFVGVRCPLATIIARRQASDPAGRYESDRETVMRWTAVHTPGVYDLEVDTSVLTPDECVARIATALAEPPAPTAFERLAATSR